MINVIEGIEYKEYIKIICEVMEIKEDKHNLEIYISKNNLRDCIDYRGGTTRIYIREKDNIIINNTIIYMLQKYRFLCCTFNKTYDKNILEIMDCYLANYYSMTLILDVMEYVNKNHSEFKYNNLDGAIRDTIVNCKYTIDNCDKNTGLGINKLIGKIYSSRNVLRKYNNMDIPFTIESDVLGDKLEELAWYNIEEKYNEILEAYNKFLTEL